MDNFDRFSSPLTLIVKPTANCNCACKYCCAGESSITSTINKDEWLDILLDRIFEECDKKNHISIIWHGYEPLLAGKNFYKSLISRLNANQEYSNLIDHFIQTNLLLLDEEWIDILFNSLKIKGMGISAEPMSGIRVLKDGQDAWKFLVDKYLLLDSTHNRGNALYILTKKSINYFEEVYWYFRNLNFQSLRINPVYAEGKATANNCKDLLISPKEYGDFIKDVIKFWNSTDKQFIISPLYDWACLNNEREDHLRRMPCAYGGNCGIAQLGIDEKLDVYPCGRFSDAKELYLGNLREMSLNNLSSELRKTQLSARRSLLRQTSCRNCSVWDYCKGGCPDDARIGCGNHMERTQWCESMKIAEESIKKL